MIKNEHLPFLKFLIELVYPRYNSHCFLMYMILSYCRLLRQQQTFMIRAVSSVELNYLIGKEVLDVDNTVLVNDTSEENYNLSIGLIFTKLNELILKRKVYVIRKHFSDKSEAILTYNLHHNLQNCTVCTFKKCEDKSLKLAEEVELSLVNTSIEWNNYFIDICLKNFFNKPKLLYVGDMVAVNILECGKEAFYLTNKSYNIDEKLYFKCHKVISVRNSIGGGYLCVNGKTTLKQTVNVQSFLPKIFSSTSYDGLFPKLYPGAFNVYFESIVKAISPFLKMDKHDFVPVFLLEGRKGIGKSILVRNLAMHLGVNLYAVNNFEVSASVYAQNETKLRNIIFSAKMCAPLVLAIENFENFGKNNEGEFDERLIDHFINEVKGLYVSNSFPIILFCISNEKNIPKDLRRLFLKTFEIRAPNDQERANLLEWILKSNKIEVNFDIHRISNRLHGFLLEDLRALVHYAVSEFSRENNYNDYVPEQYFFQALDLMQSYYNESLGAPKVPQVKWSDVGGLHDVKDEIIKTIYLPLKYPNILKSSGLKRSGILLFGPPGTGKTLLAKAVATECGLCFLSVKGPELLNMYVGQSEQNVREVFERAREASPCIVFFDELDSLAPNRGASGDSGGVMDRVVSQLLAEMDGLNQVGTVYIIGATNRPDLIDPALLRPGRFDKLLYVGPCTDDDSRIAVLRALTQKFRFESNTLLEEVVKLCPENFSGADFYGICSNAWMSAVRRIITSTEKKIQRTNENCYSPKLEDLIVTLDDFKLAIKNIKPSIKQEDMDYFYKLKTEV